MTRFIDRSGNNGTDNYHLAQVTHLYLKATEGTSFTDPSYRGRKAQAFNEGVKHVGSYHFAGSGDPRTEAMFFLSVIGKPRPGSLRPCIDVESGQTAGWVEAFATVVKDHLGYAPVFYANTSEGSALRAQSAFVRGLAWWRAEYGPDDGTVHALAGGDLGCAAHQYSDKARFTGISGFTDASVLIDERAMLLPSHLVVTVRTGSGSSTSFKGHGCRVRACAKALSLLRNGKDDLTIKQHNV